MNSALVQIEEYFNRVGRSMSDNNRKQALIIDGAEVLQNDHGMAPGMVLSYQQHLYMLIPWTTKRNGTYVSNICNALYYE